MTYRYQVKKGHENRVFADSRRVSPEVVESDLPLNSAFLELMTDSTSEQAPQQSSTPATPPAVPTAAPQPNAQENKEVAK